MSLQIVTVPCLDDNYAFLIHDPADGAAAVVDVPDHQPILKVLHQRQWVLGDILITHHHDDHISGVEPLRTQTGARVTGAAADAHRLPRLDRAVHDGNRFRIGGETVEVMDVSGHTVGHIAYHFPERRAAFTADSLMALGCGRVFEGTMLQMWTSLSRFMGMDPETLICSGHEYTMSNAAFAQSIDPGNAALAIRAAEIAAMRERGEATVPSTLAEEIATNPFLRTARPEIKSALGLPTASDAECFAELRRRKDQF